MNHNLSKFGKFLQTIRDYSEFKFVPIAIIPIAIIALLKTKKAEGEEPKNGFDKVTTFIKNNAGKLTFMAFLPQLLEEGLASIKGIKIAKAEREFLSPELLKKISKDYTASFLTYLAPAIFAGIGVYLGVKVKDAIASKKLIEENK